MTAHPRSPATRPNPSPALLGAITLFVVAIGLVAFMLWPRSEREAEVAVVGDSLVERYPGSVDLMAEEQDLELVPGTLARGGFTRQQIQPFLITALEAQPDVIVLSSGFNDFLRLGTEVDTTNGRIDPTRVSAVLDQLRTDLVADLDRITGDGIDVVYLVPTIAKVGILANLPPEYEQVVDTHTASLRATVREVVTDYPGQVCFVDLEDLRLADEITYTDDPVHPADADAVYRRVGEQIESLRSGDGCAL